MDEVYAEIFKGIPISIAFVIAVLYIFRKNGKNNKNNNKNNPTTSAWVDDLERNIRELIDRVNRLITIMEIRRCMTERDHDRE